ncbi:molybdate transport system substrate-binding protein [Microbulbifer donghaiensis]|uniref:Molybdate transport system substrate-binding protein n=1 Tax=Microbulbifer donghaiensis TaxID=494016 RepID=A0A1M4YPK5_9GAMM|nr:molybdate ABC transporter substrate-binding protein [Microbulbifer donghaiensis]SHF07608.1 molybdate transport system substrate-binding protein [Microbulbifer donghaiensis]
MGLIRALLLACLAFVPVAQATDCQLRVAAAASFRPALEALLPEFEATAQCKVQINSGSSGVLYQQALHGAPFDLFLSADRERPELLERQDKIVPGSRRTYALGLLALWLPDSAEKTSETIRGWSDTIVIADPKVAPFGVAARQVLQSLGLWDGKRAQLARAHNAGQAYLMLDAGHGQLGFVAASQMVAAGRDNYWLLPQDLYQPIEQQLVVLRQSRNADRAQALADYLLSGAVRARLAELGYGRAAGEGL